jgi:glycosyltransferase involved in cell wall biosynthesis
MIIRLPISAVIFTKNEESNIQECIESLQNFNEIIVVDSMSTDKTKNIAKKLSVQIVDFDWNGNYPKKRQWCLEEIQYKNEWILFVDADERITQELVIELNAFLQKSSSLFAAALISIDYYFAGKRMKYGQRPKKIALLKIGQANFLQIDDLNAVGMGELEGHYQPKIIGRVAKLRSKIVHNDNDPITTWMIRHVSYANWEAHLLMNKHAKNSVDASKNGASTFFHKFPFRPVAFFIYSYIIKIGFLDGKTGFDYAFAKSWYYWLSGVIARERMKDVKGQKA